MTGVLQVWQADLTDREVGLDEWNHWYDTEHMASILTVPGVRFGWRLRRLSVVSSGQGQGIPEFMAVYLLDSCRVLASPAYHLARRSAGPGMQPELTARMFAAMGSFQRGLYNVSAVSALVTGMVRNSLWAIEQDEAGRVHSAVTQTPALVWSRFECSTVERAAAPVAPARSAQRIWLSAAVAGTPGDVYRTVFAGAGRG